MSNKHYKQTDVRTMTEADGTIAFQTEANVPTALQGAVRNTLAQLNKKSTLKERMRANLTRYKSEEFKNKIVQKLDSYDFSLPPNDERVAEEWQQDGYNWRITKRIWNWKEDGDARDSLEIYVTASKGKYCWTAYVYLADAPTKYRQEGLKPYKNTRYLISL